MKKERSIRQTLDGWYDYLLIKKDDGTTSVIFHKIDGPSMFKMKTGDKIYFINGNKFHPWWKKESK